MPITGDYILAKSRTLLLLTLLVWGYGGAHPALAAKTAVIKDIKGVAHTLLDPARKATVFFFVTHDCPVSNRYAPEINRICADYNSRNIAFYLVQVDADLTAAQARQHAQDFGYRCPVLLDRAHTLVKKAGATVTPEAAVLSADGKVLYRGRIDDWYAGYGKARPRPTRRDLRLALDEVLKGETVSIARTKSIGCFIAGQ